MLLRHVIVPIVLLFTGACVDPLQVGVVGVRKVFRVPIQTVSLVPPEASLEQLIGEEGIKVVLQTAGVPRDDLETLEDRGISFLDLDAVDQVVSLDDYAGDIGLAVVSAMKDSLDEAARGSIEDNGRVTHFDSDWSRWSEWRLDLAEPDASISEALRSIPVTYRVGLRVESLSDLVGAESEELGERDELEIAFLREVGLWTVPFAEDGTKADSDFNHDAVGRSRVERCAADQPHLTQSVGARIEVVSRRDPSHRGALADVSEARPGTRCGLLIDSNDGLDLVPFLNNGFDLSIELTLAPGEDPIDLGGYILPGVEGLFQVPNSFLDL